MGFRMPSQSSVDSFSWNLPAAALTGVLLSSGDLDQTVVSSHSARHALGFWMLQKYIWPGEIQNAEIQKVTGLFLDGENKMPF